MTDTTPVDTDAETAADTDTPDGANSADSPDTSEALVAPEQLSEAIEALLMVADQPVSVVGLAQATATPTAVVSEVLSSLQKTYDGDAGGPRRGFELREVGGGWRLYARRDWDDLIRSFIHDDSPQRLSQAALETLAVVAYKQPVTRPQVSAVRAVNVDSVMRTLLARGLITEASTDPETGAIFYATTPLLLEYLGIESLEDLPPLSPLLEDGASGFDGVEH